MKQTAVEWFIKKIAEDYPEIPKAYREECNKAKEMEKQQMKEFYQDGFFIPFPSDATFEQIYKEKYETDGNTTCH